MKLSAKKKEGFQNSIWAYYNTHSRSDLPWRKNTAPYAVWISEVMLQQTQVDRVVSFFKQWMKQFPTIKKLAQANQVELLRAWKGLGYNSRALRLKRAAEMIVRHHKGVFPKTYEAILELPGIGPYTAGAISAFAYNQSVTMVETNIRRVYLHHFFKDQANIHDKELLEIISQTVDQENPREWYWALMDYGSHLGKTIPNPNKKSRHYTIQKKFKGSDREIRGKVLELLLNKKKQSIERLGIQLQEITSDSERIEKIIDQLDHEGFLTVNNGSVILRS
ncbi:MAG: A/G-specific adenine glycosylase [bacterium]